MVREAILLEPAKTLRGGARARASMGTIAQGVRGARLPVRRTRPTRFPTRSRAALARDRARLPDQLVRILCRYQFGYGSEARRR